MIKRYAIVENGVVTNVAVAYEPLFQNWIESNTASIGDLYDAATGTFTKQEA